MYALPEFTQGLDANADPYRSHPSIDWEGKCAEKRLHVLERFRARPFPDAGPERPLGALDAPTAIGDVAVGLAITLIEQRRSWFMRGSRTGSTSACDTF